MTLVPLASVLLILFFKEQIAKHTLKGIAARNKRNQVAHLKEVALHSVFNERRSSVH